jgi:hypothetical protein
VAVAAPELTAPVPSEELPAVVALLATSPVADWVDDRVLFETLPSEVLSPLLARAVAVFVTKEVCSAT